MQYNLLLFRIRMKRYRDERKSGNANPEGRNAHRMTSPLFPVLLQILKFSPREEAKQRFHYTHPNKVWQAFSILLYDVKTKSYTHLSQLDKIASIRKLQLERLPGEQHQQRELKTHCTRYPGEKTLTTSKTINWQHWATLSWWRWQKVLSNMAQELSDVKNGMS